MREDVRRCEKMWEDVRRCEDEKMRRRWEGEKMWRWEDVKMRRCEDVKMRRCEDERMWRWEDVKMRGCEDERMWRWEDVKMRRWEDVLQAPTIGRTLRSDALGKNKTIKYVKRQQKLKNWGLAFLKLNLADIWLKIEAAGTYFQPGTPDGDSRHGRMSKCPTWHRMNSFDSTFCEDHRFEVSQVKTMIKVKHFSWLKFYGFKVSIMFLGLKKLKSLGAKIFLEESSQIVLR